MITETFYKFAAEAQAKEKYQEITPVGVAASTVLGGGVGAGFGVLSVPFSAGKELSNYRNLADKYHDASAKNLHNLLDIHSKLKADDALKNDPAFRKRVNTEVGIYDALNQRAADLNKMHDSISTKYRGVMKSRALKGAAIGAAFGGLGTLAEKLYRDHKNKHS